MSIALSLGNNLTTGGVFKPTAINNTSVNNITDFAGIAGGATLVLLSTQTASASSSITFTTGIDSTYDEYVFKYINLHPATNNAYLTFQGSTDGGSNYGVTTTSTAFSAVHDEADTATSLDYNTSRDLAQSTAFIPIQVDGVSNNDDGSCVGILHLFNPSSTTYVKHFINVDQNMGQTVAYSFNAFNAGYLNTTSAINAIQFKFSSGNIDDGIIKMYGVAKS